MYLIANAPQVVPTYLVGTSNTTRGWPYEVELYLSEIQVRKDICTRHSDYCGI